MEFTPKIESATDEYEVLSDNQFEEVSIDGSSSYILPQRFSTNLNILNKNVSPKQKSSSIYMCKPCDIIFPEYHMLDKHLILVHQNTSQRSHIKKRRTKSIIEKLQEKAYGYTRYEDGKYSCNYCKYKTVLKDCITGHIARLHGNQGKSIAVRTPTVTVAIERTSVVKDEQLENIPEKRQVSIKDDNDVSIESYLIEGDVQEASNMLVDHDLDSDLIIENDEDYSEQFDEENKYENDEMEKKTTAVEDFENYMPQIDTAQEDVSQKDLEDYETIIEDLEDYESHLVEGDNEYLEDEEMQDASPLITYVCPYCDFSTTNKPIVLKHINTMHKLQWETTASDSEIQGVCQQMLERKHHTKEKQKNKSKGYNCLHCSFIARTRTILYDHARENHPGNVKPAKFRKQPPEELKCDQCDFITVDRRKMMMHIDRKHTTECRFTCEFCGKKFKVKCDLTSHIRFQHFKVPLVCDVCGKVCNNSNSLHVHQKREHFKPKFECQICHRRMVTKENLDEHILRQHEQRTRFMCDQCGKVFDQASKLKQHTMTHTGERPHNCHLCGKAFARRAVFRQHLLIHTGERPYVCDICGKSFTQKPGLICHRKMHPGDKPPLPVVYIDHILKRFEKKDD